ncbi:hypothetical protein [Nocardia yunnanensis]|uniref:hypothetical protein n=1 Tax=Nocardia yunnanensis TaxID=2382165 RepID=UPI0013C4842F|nr:hypothetical protein [Nocardia yunnanensis]
MWSWSEHVAKRAAASSPVDWRTREPEPTVTDPEYTETTDDDGMNGPNRPGEEISEDALAGLFDALADMLHALPGVH